MQLKTHMHLAALVKELWVVGHSAGGRRDSQIHAALHRAQGL